MFGIADSRFHSTKIQEWGITKRIGFCMSQAGNPVCTPEFMRCRNNPIAKYMKACGRGQILTFHSQTLNFTIVRDSAVLRIVDNCLEAEDLTPRNARQWN